MSIKGGLPLAGNPVTGSIGPVAIGRPVVGLIGTVPTEADPDDCAIAAVIETIRKRIIVGVCNLVFMIGALLFPFTLH